MKWKAHNGFRLHTRVSNLLANQQAFSQEQASFRMQIFCSLNAIRDQYGGFLHAPLSAYKRLCNVNAAQGRSGDIFGKIILVEKGGHFLGFGNEIFIVGADTAQSSKLRVRN